MGKVEIDPIKSQAVGPDELFLLVGDILRADGSMPVSKMMHDVLVLTCHEALAGTHQSFGNLFAQVDFLCRRHGVSVADTVAIQRMRHDSNRNEPLSAETLGYDLRALSMLISAVFHVDIPSSLVGKLPVVAASPGREVHHVDYRYLRCIVRTYDEQRFTAVVDGDVEEHTVTVDYAAEPHLIYIYELLHEGLQLNLLDFSVADSGEKDHLLPLPSSVIVVEPDYLIDISSIARCFTDYGHHPLSYVVNSMSPAANSQAILVGNFAGAALDDIINCGEDYSWSETFKNNFKEKALEYCTCDDLNRRENFKVAAQRQVENIKEAVDQLFGHDFDRGKAILEPSFVCERLGIQGRVDLMTTDFALLVEQKSGSNFSIQTGRPNEYGSFQKEDHYVQLLLYYGVLRQNFNLGSNKTDIRLLYSKYPLPGGLVVVNYYRKLFQEAIRFRNRLVAAEYDFALNGFQRALPLLNPATLNEARLDNRFFQQWILPQIKAVTEPLAQLSALERAYYCRMMTFVYKEQLVAKVGAQEGVGNATADLWNMPLAQKKETGNIYTDLQIVRRAKSSAYNGYDTITLDVPAQGEDFLPNFRRGDMIYLYAYREGDVPDVRKALLFKGALVDITSSRLVVHLNDGQQNPHILSPEAADGVCYAIEHGGHLGASSSIRSLHQFITAPQSRRDLLLGQCTPRIDRSVTLSQSYHPDYDSIVLRARQAMDYFLLVGPPGTGKTSMALQFLVREFLAHGDEHPSILLMSYTNRAVDEICGMLSDSGLPYIRIGSEYTCDARFHDHLLSNLIEESPRLDVIRQRLLGMPVIVGTTSTIQSKSYIFDLKHFTLAIVDEASQILEPGLVGLLTRPDRFILIGDHKQLPAVVQQDASESGVAVPELVDIELDDCRHSLFERLVRWERRQHRTDFVGILNRQGRMHPDIADFPARMFYAEEQLQPVPLPHQRETRLPYLALAEDNMDRLLKSHRMVFIASQYCRQPHLSDKVNTHEASIVADVARRIYRFYGERFDAAKTIGVIVPYRNQIAMIRKSIEALGIPALEQISIDTVERYQGSQRDVIVYSFTIQHRYQLDFLAGTCFLEDEHIVDRKLNVALTRARQQLILTGNRDVLQGNRLFSQLMEYVEEKGGML
uniref:AAA domain-containing protein n=1 Tax=Prevotella sp. GTC17259 TaxID=3236795 RepID=A0AB33JAS6_9BACT